MRFKLLPQRLETLGNPEQQGIHAEKVCAIQYNVSSADTSLCEIQTSDDLTFFLVEVKKGLELVP